jgi:peptide/nickel transport system substrate-binding protein
MEPTWKIKSGALWHDGRPVTSDDFAFTAKVEQDRDLAVFRNVAYDSLEGVDAPDPHTVRANWKRPYIDADQMFNAPIPKHVFERSYVEDKASFLQLPHWAEEFVGTGPFTLQEFVKGSHVVLRANERYVFGRPRIDEVEVKFIPDTNTLMANLLAGTVSLTLGRSLSIEQGVQVRDQWRDGKLSMGAFTSWVTLYPQMLTPNPLVVADPRFRRALLHAIDREEMANALQGVGLVPLGHSFIGPGAPEYKAIEGRVVRYEYDPRKAIQMLEQLGYTRGPGGTLQDRSGAPLTVGMRVIQEESDRLKAATTVSDFWQQIGMRVNLDVTPSQGSTSEYCH